MGGPLKERPTYRVKSFGLNFELGSTHFPSLALAPSFLKSNRLLRKHALSTEPWTYFRNGHATTVSKTTTRGHNLDMFFG